MKVIQLGWLRCALNRGLPPVSVHALPVPFVSLLSSSSLFVGLVVVHCPSCKYSHHILASDATALMVLSSPVEGPSAGNVLSPVRTDLPPDSAARAGKTKPKTAALPLRSLSRLFGDLEMVPYPHLQQQTFSPTRPHERGNNPGCFWGPFGPPTTWRSIRGGLGPWITRSVWWASRFSSRGLDGPGWI